MRERGVTYYGRFAMVVLLKVLRSGSSRYTHGQPTTVSTNRNPATLYAEYVWNGSEVMHVHCLSR